MFQSALRLVFLILFFLVSVSSVAHAATTPAPILGNVVWTKAESPYIVSYVNIPDGASLTIEQGTIIKVPDSGYPFIVNGTLTIGSSGGEEVVITSMKDDSVGGDTNGDGGATAPGAGDWREITFNPGSTGNITNTIIRYGGASFYSSWTGGYFIFPLIDNKGGILTLDHVTLTQSGNNGLEQFSGTTTIMDSILSDSSRGIVNYGGSLTIGNNTFTNLGGYAITVHGATNFINHGRNTGGRGIYMAYGIFGAQTWSKDTLPYVTSGVHIPAGSSLTIAPGAVVKATADAWPFYVDGALTIGASSATEDAYVTSIKDDSMGGDTNGDGNSTIPNPADWRKIHMNAGSIVTLAHASIKYGGATPYNPYNGGYFTYPLIENNGGVLSIDHSQLAQSGYYGVLQNAGTTTVSNSIFANISKWGVYNAHGNIIVASTTFSTMERGIAITEGTIELGGNTFNDMSSHALSCEGAVTLRNHGGNQGIAGMFISLTVTGAQTFPKDGLVYIVNYLGIPVGSTLTILPGAIVKVPFNTNPFYIDGTLTIGDTASTDKVFITSIKDDLVGGDTNGDATSTTPNSGDWRSITFNSGSYATIHNTVIRYGGASPYNSWTGGADWLPAIRNTGGTLEFDHTTLTNNGNFGILQISGTTTIIDSTIAQTDRYGIFLSGGVLSMHHSKIYDNATYGLYNGTASIIDATNNWWGSATGPTHPSNPLGTGDNVSDNVNYGQWLTAEPTTSTPPVLCTVDCYSNVLFLPGLQASRLYRQYPNCLNNCERMLWTPDGSPYLEDLHLTASGTSIWSDIYTRDVLDEALGFNIYKSFLADLEHWKNDENIFKDYSAIPYDWRLSLDALIGGGYQNPDGTFSYLKATSTPYIIQELERLAATSTTGKVTIVGHSNGGLVAKALMVRLKELGKEDLVDNVVLVASPQTGTPQALGAILHGYNQALPTEWFSAMLSKAKARTMALNMPGAYHLLPSEQYFRDVQTPVASFANSSPLLSDAYAQYGSLLNSWNEMNNFVLGNETLGGRGAPEAADLNTPSRGNAFLLAYARDIHRTLDAWTPPFGVQVFQIAGWGVDTLSTIKYTQKKKGADYVWREDFTMTEDGDGTVVAASAHAMNANPNVERWWVNLGEYNSKKERVLEGRINIRKHADILEVSNLRDFLQDIISKKISSSFSSHKYLATSMPEGDPEKRLRYFLHSPLSLELYDNEGHHVGYSTTTGVLEEQIHGAYYGEFGEVKYISVPASTTLHVVMDGYATDVFTLNIEEVQGDTILATTTFADIPSSTSTIVTMDFTDGTIGNASPLHIDSNGDGAIDHNLTAVLGGEVTLPTPKLPLTVTTINKTITLGAPIPFLTATLSGFQNGDIATSSVTGSSSCTTAATTASPVGTYSITCTIGTLASQKYDFATFTTGTLTILYKWSGFLQPINDVVYNPTQSMSVFKGGSTVPVKFQLKTATGTIVQSKTLPLFLLPQKGSAMSASVDESTYSDPATSGTAFKWDSASQQYIYNWSTKGLLTGYWYRVYTKLEDGTTQSVVVGIR